MDIQDLYNHSDHLLRLWIQNDNTLRSQDAFLAIQKEGKGLLTEKYFGTMPEPFWGNPDCCSVVMINLNPAYKEGHELLFSREKTKKLIPNGYSSFAKGFPILDEDSYNPEGKVWWEGRKKYLDRLVDAYPGKKHPDEKRRPFAIEICPWQTATWQETKINIARDKSLNSYIQKHVLDPAIYAVKNSQVDFAVGIGLPIIDALLDYGFTIVKSWGPKTDDESYRNGNTHSLPANYPTTYKKGEAEKTPAEVFFKLLVKGDLKVLCIRMSGSNGVPRPEFRDCVEPEILTYISDM